MFFIFFCKIVIKKNFVRISFFILFFINIFVSVNPSLANVNISKATFCPMRKWIFFENKELRYRFNPSHEWMYDCNMKLYSDKLTELSAVFLCKRYGTSSKVSLGRKKSWFFFCISIQHMYVWFSPVWGGGVSRNLPAVSPVSKEILKRFANSI